AVLPVIDDESNLILRATSDHLSAGTG
ncbi:MAG: hypothetical protein RJA81_440, partial [Planctomycetota bacterium]